MEWHQSVVPGLRLGVALNTRRDTFTPDSPCNVYIF